MSDHIDHGLGRRTFLKATGTAGAAAAVGATQVTIAEPTDRPEDELLVTVSGAGSVQTAEVEIQQALPSEADVVWRNENMNVLSVLTPEQASTQAVDRLKRQLESRADVKYVEENQVHDLHVVDDPGLDQQYAPDQTNAIDVWADGFLGEENVDVAIFDTGVQYDHPDLQAQFGRDVGIAPGDSGSDPMDDQGHGTHVAGIASATTDNGEGIAGQSNSRLWAVKVFPNATSRTTIEALDWAIEQGIDVVNGSYGGGSPTQAEQNAFQRALDNGVLPFFSAGNDGPTRDSVSYPGAYPETICVSALEEGENIARFSSRGPEVDITGPGAQVLSTYPTNDYDTLSGTSMSSPAVAGVCALGWETTPDASATEVRAALFETARNVGLPETQQGNGCADAARLVEQLGGPGDPGDVIADIDASTTTPEVGEEVVFDIGDSRSENGDLVTAQWEAEAGGSGTGAEFRQAWSSPGQYQVTLTVEDEVGETDTTSKTVAVGDDAGPVAEIDAPTTEPAVGDDVELDGTASSSPNGEIVEYAWNAEPGGSATGETVVLTRDEPVTVEVTLTVEDELGETDSTSRTFEFEDEGPVCGEEDYVGSADGSISWWNGSDVYSFATQTSNPCQVTFDLDGPADADFDLFVTFDGRTPTPSDFDASSEGPDANETIVVDVPEETTSVDFGILIEGVAGWGSYTITVEELGF